MEEVHKNRLANVALILSCLGLLLSVLTAIPALICGIVALVNISQSDGKLLGKGVAITAIVISSLLILFFPIHLLLIMVMVVEATAVLPYIYTLF